MESPSSSVAGKDITFEEHGLPGFVIHPDNSVSRSPFFPDLPAHPHPQHQHQPASNDVFLTSSSCSLWVRIFLPSISSDGGANGEQKLPVMVFFHGGAFVLLSPSSEPYHNFCEKLAKDANAIVVSVDYRLAPEHRLPAAYNDAFTAMKWIQSQALISSDCMSGVEPEPWLTSRADFTSVFLLGDSAGGNIAYQLALRLAQEVDAMKPLRVKGVMLIQPAVGGSLQEGDQSSFIGNRHIWRLALPKGAEMDEHVFCNPCREPLSRLEKLALPKIVLVVGGLDKMQRKQIEFAHWLRKAKQSVELTVYEEASHGFIYSPEMILLHSSKSCWTLSTELKIQ